MAEFAYTITDEAGIHARPAALLVKLAKELGGGVTVRKGERAADASQLMSVMGLGIKEGDTVTVSAADAAKLSQVRGFFEKHF